MFSLSRQPRSKPTPSLQRTLAGAIARGLATVSYTTTWDTTTRDTTTDRAREHQAVAHAKAYLREHCHEAVTLDELCALSGGLSRFRLVHAFRREVGLPPHGWQIHLRIARARSLLQAGMSPAKTAIALGFADQSHFTRHFRRIMRVTPGAYAQARP